ncbi:hypothetical protein HYG89_14595 [Acinetobacter sp. SwsAc5]|uniref:hypothetical protein n=1 Tax=Acinetobacter sp. SwsAc5 TaxID=2749438 RepID=UPI0015B982BB|nr:hypothetical protein [Acinetobacter sp. SwsAc5]NWK53752.1 hypothetical protein [Acinetobacter sp. SwsAc5]
MSEQFIIDLIDRSYTFEGEELANIEGHPYPDSCAFYKYAVYLRDSDNYYVCVDRFSNQMKIVESPKQVIDFFGLDPIAKRLFDELEFSYSVEISSQEHGEGTSVVLDAINDFKYEFVGQLLHRSFTGEGADYREIYKLNTEGYISVLHDQRGYRNVQLLDELGVIEALG